MPYALGIQIFRHQFAKSPLRDLPINRMLGCWFETDGNDETTPEGCGTIIDIRIKSHNHFEIQSKKRKYLFDFDDAEWWIENGGTTLQMKLKTMWPYEWPASVLGVTTVIVYGVTPAS